MHCSRLTSTYFAFYSMLDATTAAPFDVQHDVDKKKRKLEIMERYQIDPQSGLSFDYVNEINGPWQVMHGAELLPPAKVLRDLLRIACNEAHPNYSAAPTGNLLASYTERFSGSEYADDILELADTESLEIVNNLAHKINILYKDILQNPQLKTDDQKVAELCNEDRGILLLLERLLNYFKPQEL